MRVVVDPSTNWEWYEGVRRGDDLPQPGYRVIGEHLQGGFAEFAVVPAANLVQLPDEVTYETAAAAALVFATAWGGLMGRAAVRPGERVLVTGGSGGVATAAIQVARRAGATVIVLTSGPENVRRIRELGAEVVLDRLSGKIGDLLKGATGARGVDVVFDSVGQPLWASLLRCLRPGGRLVCYGSTVGHEAMTDLRHVFWKRLSILGTTMASPAEFVEVMRLVFEGKLTPVIDRTLALEELAEAHRALEGGEVFGKIVFRL
jgi:NADPH:quinone reductase-like Zn-dependent oxidoreductase